jgi:hypothetical protein
MPWALAFVEETRLAGRENFMENEALVHSPSEGLRAMRGPDAADVAWQLLDL